MLLSNFSLSLCLNRRNRVTTTTVIARADRPVAISRYNAGQRKCSKYGTMLADTSILCAIIVGRLYREWCSAQRIKNQNDCRWQSYLDFLPRRQKPPRNDTVEGSWAQWTNCTINPNFAFCILHFVRQHDKSHLAFYMIHRKCPQRKRNLSVHILG